MNEIAKWISAREHRIPIGEYAKSIVEYLTTNYDTVFDSFTKVFEKIIEGTADLFSGIPALLLIALIAALAYYLQRSWKLVIFAVLGLLLTLNFNLWTLTVQTFVLVIYSTLVSLLIGVPIGIIAARRPAFYQFLSPILDLMQTLPTFVYLVPVLSFFGLGVVPALVATVIFVVPSPIRLTYLGISQVSKPLVEAGESFGCTRWQLLTKVKLPAAMPTIMAGVNQTIMLSLSMVVIAALVGASSLGKPVVLALNQRNVPLSVESGLGIVIVAILLDRIMKQRRQAPRRKSS
ncbi:MAG: choline ABC transporter permease subunit [Proteobacteria bacterium]|nr:choline ABC transporter permease subunit [Pseudomonadota bacterium]